MKAEVLPVFIGYDERERDAYDVCSFSLQRKSSIALHVRALKHRELRERGLFTRPWRIDGATGRYIDERDGRPFSTEFAFTRFLVPAIQDYDGWALFMDCDILALADIGMIVREFDDSKAVMVVKQNHIPQCDTKMDGQIQSVYPRKNWSSVMAFNCGHPSNRGLTPEFVNHAPGRDLHGLSWLEDEEIGALDPGWNFLVGETKNTVKPKLMHYTNGGPWFEHMRKVPFAGWWQNEFDHMMKVRGKYE